MIKFVLVMQMCFTLTQTCLPPIKSVELYDTHKDCSLAGYKEGIEEMFFEYFNNMPFWYQALFIGVVSAIYGLKGADIIKKK
jgi:hypothetical protein